MLVSGKIITKFIEINKTYEIRWEWEYGEPV